MSNVMMQQSGEQLGIEQRSEGLSTNDSSYAKPNLFQFFFNSLSTMLNSLLYVGYYYNTVRETMEQVKNNKDDFYPDEYYKKMGIPSLDQYSAFNELYDIVGNNSFFEKHKKGIFNHACLPYDPIIIKLLKHIDISKKGRVKKITVTCGSFWRKNQWVREEVIGFLNHLSIVHNVEVEIYTNCRNDEEGISKLSKNIKFLHLDTRVMIHFIIIDDEYIFFEYPHSEKIYLRLYMLLTPKDLNSPMLKQNKTKILDFLRKKIIDRALTNQ